MLFLAITALLEGGLYAVMVPFLGPEDAMARAMVMLPPVLWTARLGVALKRGRITRRLVRWGGPAINQTFLRLTDPEVYVRREQPWNFHGYLLFEGFCCLVVWGLFGGSVVLTPILDVVGVEV